MSDLELLLSRLLAEEEELQFSAFTNETALALGLLLVDAARQTGKAVAIDITRNSEPLFYYALEGTSQDNYEWICRKRRTVQRFGHSTYYMGTKLRHEGKTLEEKYLVSPQEYAAHGGGFPLRIRNVGLVGSITVSGLPQKEDHALVVDTLRAFLNSSHP